MALSQYSNMSLTRENEAYLKYKNKSIKVFLRMHAYQFNKDLYISRSSLTKASLARTAA